MSQHLSQDGLSAAEEAFRAYLRTRGLKYTPERRLIFHGVMQNEQHFEADQLLMDLRAANKRVAKATIYRTLPLLVECGIIKQVQFGEKQTRYEHTYGHAPHDHMVCLRCRRIIEFDSSKVRKLVSCLATAQRFLVASHRFQILGLCAECRPGEIAVKDRHNRNDAPNRGRRTSAEPRRRS